MPPSVFFHVDIDAFFASVEQIDDPALVGKPVIVGARPGGRGVVSTCSYEARSRGVHSAMPIQEAVRICPDGVFLPVRMERYREASDAVFAVFESFCAEPQALSIDEAFLDMTGTGRLFGESAVSAAALKRDVSAATGLRVSVGIAPNRFLAKIASARSKPDGLLEVKAGEEIAFMDSLPLGRLWGAGEKTQERLRSLNLRSMADIRNLERDVIGRLLGKGTGDFLYHACRGIDPGFFQERDGPRSVSTERTFERDIADEETLEAILLDLCQESVHALIKKGLLANCVIVKLRYGDFTSVSARMSLKRPVSSIDDAFRIATALLREKRRPAAPLRLLGLGFSGLDEGDAAQGLLFDDDRRRADLDRAILGMDEKTGLRSSRARALGRKPNPWRGPDGSPGRPS
jgi:DNA polymerase IV